MVAHSELAVVRPRPLSLAFGSDWKAGRGEGGLPLKVCPSGDWSRTAHVTASGSIFGFVLLEGAQNLGQLAGTHEAWPLGPLLPGLLPDSLTTEGLVCLQIPSPSLGEAESCHLLQLPKIWQLRLGRSLERPQRRNVRG